MRNVWFGQKRLKGKKEFYVWPNFCVIVTKFWDFIILQELTDRRRLDDASYYSFDQELILKTQIFFYDVNVCYILLERYECAFHFQCEWTYFNVSEFSDKAHKSSRSLAFKGRMRVLAFMLHVEHNTFLESSCIELKLYSMSRFVIHTERYETVDR